MLTGECFAAGMTVLEARFGPVTKQGLGSAGETVKAFYRKTLAAVLDDHSFSLAIEGVICDCRFFPTPKEIIEAGIGTPRDIALGEWNALVQYRAQPNQPLSCPISEAGQYAADSVGGVRFVCNAMNPASRGAVRRDYIESYELAVRRGKSTRINQVKTLKESEAYPDPTVDPEGLARIAALIENLVMESV